MPFEFQTLLSKAFLMKGKNKFLQRDVNTFTAMYHYDVTQDIDKYNVIPSTTADSTAERIPFQTTLTRSYNSSSHKS